jgi:hypothetical protein
LCYVRAQAIFILTDLHVPAPKKQLSDGDLGDRGMVPGHAGSRLTADVVVF